MAQNIYDDPEFFARYSQLRRQVHGLAGAPEWPAVRELIPDPARLHVADLGCGFGWASRWFREQGAASVTGYDLSLKMLERARSDTRDAAVEYRQADLQELVLEPASVGIVYSSLAFHYIADFTRLVRMIHAALKPGGDLIFTIEHPIFMAAAQPGWTFDAAGRKSWRVNDYAIEGERRTDWFAQGVLKYHRTMGTTLNTLIEAGFTLRHIQEFAPDSEQIDNNPGLAEELERPMILLVAAHKGA